MASRASPSTTLGKREPNPEHLRAVIETSVNASSPALRSSMRKKGGPDHARRAAGMRASFSSDHTKHEGASRTLVFEYDDAFPGSPDSSITRSIRTRGVSVAFSTTPVDAAGGKGEYEMLRTAHSPMADTDVQTGYGGGTSRFSETNTRWSPYYTGSESPLRQAGGRGKHRTRILLDGSGSDGFRSKTAYNARELVKDLSQAGTEVSHLLKDRGKDINPRTGRIRTAKWLKRHEPATKDLNIKQVIENQVLCKLLLSSDGQRLIAVGKGGTCKIFRSTLEDLAGKAGSRLPDTIDQDTELWVEEQQVVGHPDSCLGAALEPSKADIFVVVGGDNVIRLFGEGILNGPLEQNGIAPTKVLRLELAKRNEPSTGSLDDLVARLRQVLKFEPQEARRLGVLENPEECKELKRHWVCVAEFAGSEHWLGVNHDKKEVFMRIFDCDFHPLSREEPLLGTGWSNGDVRWYIGQKRAKIMNSDFMTYDSWEFKQYQVMQCSADAIFACKFSPSGEQFVTASKDWTVCVYMYPRAGVRWGIGPGFIDRDDAPFQRLNSSEVADLEFQLVSRLPGHNAPVLGLAFHPSGEIIATGGADDIGMLWTFKSPEGDDGLQPQKLGMSENWQMLVRGHVGASRRLHVPEWNSLGFLQGHSSYVTACAFRADGIVLATASRDCTVIIWRMPRHFSQSQHVSHRVFKPLQVLKCRAEVSSLGFGRLACTSLLFAGTYTGEIYSWDTDTRLPCILDEVPHDSGVSLKFQHTTPGSCALRSDLRARSSEVWSRMSTPYELVPKPAESLGIRDESLDPKRFAAVDPWETRVCKAEKLQLGARGKSKNGLRSAMKSEYRRQDETLLDKALRLMHRTVQVVFKEEQLLAACMEFDQSGLITLIEACNDPLDWKDCLAVLHALVQKCMPLIVKSELRKTLPQAPRGRINPDLLLFRREEVSFFLSGAFRSPIAQSARGDNHKGALRKLQGTVREGLPPIAKNDHGQSLAQSLVDQNPAEAKKILTGKFVAAVSPQLAWKKSPDRTARKVVDRLLEGLPDNVPLPNDDFTNYCSLLYNLNILYHRVADILTDIHAEQSSKGADVLTIQHGNGKGSVSFGGREEAVDTLAWWSGLRDKPRKEDKLQTPLFSANTPAYIGVVFSPGKPYALKSFSIFLAHAARKQDKQEQTFIIPGVPDHSPLEKAGVAFRCTLLAWNTAHNHPGEVLWESKEAQIANRHFQEFMFPLEEAGLRRESYEEVFIALTSEDCSARHIGCAWVAGIGEQSRGGRRTPQEIRKGVYCLSGRRIVSVPGAKPQRNTAWAHKDELMACKIVYQTL